MNPGQGGLVLLGLAAEGEVESSEEDQAEEENDERSEEHQRLDHDGGLSEFVGDLGTGSAEVEERYAIVATLSGRC